MFRIAGHADVLPIGMPSVFGYWGRYALDTMDSLGEYGRADRYICGALSDIGVWKAITNRRASTAKAAKSGS
jgi:hypothetical protein